MRRVGERIRARIAASPHRLSVVFPAVRPVATGTSPGPAPVRPFTGTQPTPTVAGPPTTALRPPVELPCLWLDADTLGALRNPGAGESHGLWASGASALARINPEDLPPDSEGPEAFFAAAEYVEFKGKRYDARKVTPAGPSDEDPYTWYLWLWSFAKQ